MITRYRALLSLAAPAIAAWLGIARVRGRLTAADLSERLGGGAAGDAGPVRRGPVIWVHGASMGEIGPARPLIEAALRRDPSLRFIVTTNSTTGRDAVRAWQMPAVTARLAPLDYRYALRRFLTRWQPDALVSIENEIWPNRFQLCGDLGIPVLLIGARLSQNSAANWRKLGGAALADAMRAVTYLAAQDDSEEDRFVQLGVARRALGPHMQLKGSAALTLSAADHKTLAALTPAFARTRTILAASTHEGEETQVLRAFVTTRELAPDVRLILAPRHPERGADVAAHIAATGLPFARRSEGEMPGDAPIYLADTMGEMALWYRLAGITFIGGTLVPKGGHTPFEPSAAKSAIVHGPHVANNAAAYDLLARGGGALPVSGADDLATAMMRLVSAPERATALAEAATAALQPLRDNETARAALFTALAKQPRLANLSG